MKTTPRKSLYSLMKKLGKTHIGKEDAPIFSINRGQIGALVDGVTWINWSVTADQDGSEHSRRLKLRAMIDEKLPALKKQPVPVVPSWTYIPFVLFGALIVGLFSLGVVGIILGAILLLLAIGLVGQLVSTATGGALLIAVAGIALAMCVFNLRNNRYVRTVHGIRTWLNTSEVLIEPAPHEWVESLQDPEVHDLIAAWMLARPEIDSLEAHISEGVLLHGQLPRMDPRRDTVQAEIDAQRNRRDALLGLRDTQAFAITHAAESYLAEKRRALEVEAERQRKARKEQQDREEYLRRLREIDASEQANIKNHERLDEWFDRGA